MKLLEGYVLCLVGNRVYIGKQVDFDGAHLTLEPAYDAHVSYEADRAGNFAVIRECVPLLGSGLLKRIEDPTASAVVVKCEDLSGKEREGWSKAISGAEEIAKVIRSAESGLVLATQDATKLPSPPGGELVLR